MSLDMAALVAFVRDELAADITDIDEDTPLFSSGVLDSFAIVSLLMFLETEGRFRILPSDVSMDNFDTLARIMAFVEMARAEFAEGANQ